MIYCPHCGTPNKPTSKFCKNCAALLAPSTDVRCPICGTMNLQGASACSNCGTRLNTGSAGALNSNDRTTPADTPEQISPFNPPAFSAENPEPEPTDPPTPVNRPSFARANSEWLRRIQKTPPPADSKPEPTREAPTAPSASTPAEPPATPAASSAPPSNTDWLQALDTASSAAAPSDSAPTEPTAAPAASNAPPSGTDWLQAIDTEPATRVSSEAPEATVSESEAIAAKPVLSEIKLTGDDYDYSDIGGEVTDEMKAQLEASATQLTDTEDEVALARRLLGLDAEADESPVAPIVSPPSAAVIETAEPVPPAEPIARAAPMAPPGYVAAAASAANEPPAAFAPIAAPEFVASAADVPPAPLASPPPAKEFEASAPVANAEPPTKPVLSEIKLTGDDYDYSDIGGEVTDEMKAQLEASATQLNDTEDEVALARRLLGLDADVSATPAAPVIREPVAGIESPVAATPLISEPVAEIETPAASAANEPILPLEIPPTGFAEIVAAKPVLSEIKLTGDDYDYSDIGGEVTDEMKAQLEASATQLTDTEDEVALARRLLGLDADVPAMPAAPIATAPIEATAPPAPETHPQPEADSPEWLTALAAASSAAVAGQVVQDEMTPPAAELASAETLPVELPPQAEIPVEAPPSAAEPLAALPAATQLGETIAQQPIETVALTETAAPVVAEPPAAASIPTTKPGLESGNLPEWLREIAPPDLVARDAGVEFPSDVTTISADDEGPLPAWVQELAPKAEQVNASSIFKPLPDLDESEREELPDWLKEPPAPIEAETPPPAAVTVPVTMADDESGDESEAPSGIPGMQPELVPAMELPSWFTDSAPGANALRDPFEPVETTGPLAGVSGILPLAVAITEPHILTTVSPTRSDGGRIFQTILAEPLTAASQPAVQPRATALFQPKHILYLVILLAALIPLFFPLDSAGLGLDATKSSSAVFYDQMQAVPRTKAVLVVFDYSPGEAVELDPAARVIVNTFAKREIPVISVSTNETGATIAQGILERAKVANPAFTIVNVGYLPGKETAILGLAKGWLRADQPVTGGSNWGASPLARTTQSMNDLGLTVLFSPNSDALRIWVEQAKPNITSPMVAATSAAVEPQARNYVNAKQLQGSLRGLTGAAELELLTNSAGQAVKTVDALSFVSLALAGIIIAANIIAMLKRGKPETK